MDSMTNALELVELGQALQGIAVLENQSRQWPSLLVYSSP